MSLPEWIARSQDCSSALARGTGRQALPVGDGTATSQLAVLAGLAAYGRMRIPETPDSFEHNESSVNEGMMVNDAIRLVLLRCFKASRERISDASILRVFELLRATNRVVHPFDYVELEHLIRYRQSHFDTQFRQWAAKRTTMENNLSDISPANWTEFSTAERCEYIRMLHNVDAEAARVLLINALPDETASVRGKLVQSIESSVTIADHAFLESLLSDRAKSIKDVASTMLSFLPGTEQNRERMEEAASRLSLKKGKLIGRKKLVVEQPKGYKNHSHNLIQWYQTTFSGVDPVVLAAALDLKPKEFLELIEQPYLACQCVFQLAKQNDIDLMTPLAMRNADVLLPWMANYHEVELYALSTEAKELFWCMATNAMVGKNIAHWVEMLEQIYLRLHITMPKGLSLKLVKDKKFVTALKELLEDIDKQDREILERLASILDTSCYPDLKIITKDAPPFLSTYANQLMSLVQLLEDQDSIVPNIEN